MILLNACWDRGPNRRTERGDTPLMSVALFRLTLPHLALEPCHHRPRRARILHHFPPSPAVTLPLPLPSRSSTSLLSFPPVSFLLFPSYLPLLKFRNWLTPDWSYSQGLGYVLIYEWPSSFRRVTMTFTITQISEVNVWLNLYENFEEEQV